MSDTDVDEPGAIASDPEGMAFAVQVGVNPEQLQNTHRVDLRDAVTVVPASDTILESTQKALRDAEAWLAVHAA